MALTLEKIVPWGRTFEEYVAMFDLTEADLKRPILGCGDGPAVFNAELTRRGGRVVSADPLYALNATQIRRRIKETYESVIAQMSENKAGYVWTTISSVEELGQRRRSAMDTFLASYEDGKRAGRYVQGELPALPFDDRSFDIALSSHFLFLYSGHLTLEFHLEALSEMLRIAHEARVFPLLSLDGTPSPFLPFVVKYLSSQGFAVETRRVPYEFQRGANEMLCVRPASESTSLQ